MANITDGLDAPMARNLRNVAESKLDEVLSKTFEKTADTPVDGGRATDLRENARKAGKLSTEFLKQVALPVTDVWADALRDEIAARLNAIAENAPISLASVAAEYAESGKTTPSKEEVLARLQTLMDPDFGSDRSGKRATFSDMRMMHALDPDNVKEIRLTGFDTDSKEAAHISADSTPDPPIAVAARISMAHPLIASAVKR
jgi:hypothetical protein